MGFCISFSFVKYWIKILFILVTDFEGSPLNFVPEATASLTLP